MRKIKAAVVAVTAMALSVFMVAPASAITCGDLDPVCAVAELACQKVTKQDRCFG